MHFPSIAIVASLLAVSTSATPADVEARAVCNRDNCFRTVAGNAGTRPPLATRSASCRAGATAVPAYASAACKNLAAYSSACACGFPSTSTSTPASTSSTPTVTPSPTFAFTLTIASAQSSILVNQIAYVQLNPGFGNFIYFGDRDPTQFYLDASGYLNDAQGVFVVQQTGNDPIRQYTAPASSLRLKCSLGAAAATATTGTFTCSAPAGNGFDSTVFSYCGMSEDPQDPNGLYLSLDGNSCPYVQLQWNKIA